MMLCTRRFVCHFVVAALIAFSLIATFAACDKAETPDGPSSDGTVTTVPATESETEKATEGETEAETVAETLPENLDPSDPEILNDFTLSESYHVLPNEKQGTVTVKVGDKNISLDMNSIFYGTESAIDRDSFHWGNILAYEDLRITKFRQEFRIGDFNGDRKGEAVTYVDGKLTISRFPDRGGSLKEVYTQSLGFEGILCGTGLVNDDFYTDIVLYDTVCRQVVIGFGGAAGFEYTYAAGLPDVDVLGEADNLFTGDFDADGTTDLIRIRDLEVTTYCYSDGVFSKVATTTLPHAESGQFLLYAVADMNSDGAADVVGYMKDHDGSEHYGTCSYMSRRDGHFGSYESEGNNKNINPVHIHNEGFLPLFVAGGDITGDGVDDLCLIANKTDRDRVAVFAVGYPTAAPAYDYSSHIIKTDDGYILYTGGLYTDYNTDKYPATDADHIMAYTSKDGITWYRNLDAACFYLGSELGVAGPSNPYTDKWWIGNTMEPEVVYVDGVYYMYYQVENYTYDKNGELMGADRIGVATSTDGIHFERKTDRPVLITSDIYSCFTHQEVIYVPDDPDGKCFWMYVRYVHNNRDQKRILLRSADPLCFNMDEGYTEVSGMLEIGNQIGYINDYNGKSDRLFVRITFTIRSETSGDTTPHAVPTLQFSLDGIRWSTDGVCLAGVDMNEPNERERMNMYFLGFSTINGTGEIAKTEDGTGYEIIYVGSTSNSPVAPGIFYSSEGVGKAVFTITSEN